MIKEASEYLFNKGFAAGKTDNANKVNFLDRMCDPRTLVYEFNGAILDRIVKPALRDHHVDSVDDLIVAAEKWGTAGVIWLSRAKVVLIVDDADRRERVTLELTCTQVFSQVLKLVANPNLDQATLIRLLRRDFRRSPDAVTALSAVRKMKFSTRNTGHSDIQHGNESLGNAIEAEVTGADDITDTIRLPTPIFINPGEEVVRFNLTLDLEIVVANRTHPFLLRPMPDDVDAAYATALESIKERLAEGLPEMTILYGQP